MSISKIKEINKKFDEEFAYMIEPISGEAVVLNTNSPKEIKSFYTQQILSLIEELEDKEKWLGFFTEDIKNCFIPKCGWCGKIATEQTVKGKDEQESHGRPVNWGYYCKSCYAKGLKMEEEAMYG